MSTRVWKGSVLAALVLIGGAGPALASHGTWDGFSQQAEPNTKWDTKAYMWQTPNQANVEKIYFNGLVISGAPTTGAPFPTPGFPSGAPGARPTPTYDLDVQGGNILTPDGYYFVAVLGFWRDCNKDGYIGARNVPATYGNFAVYPRAAYAIDESVCPLGTPYNPMNPETGSPNGFIDEFRWIGPGAGCDPYEANCPGNPFPASRLCIPPSARSPCVRVEASSTDDPNDVTDNMSRVWADWNFPGGRHVYDIGYTTLPAGTYYDSDGTLKYMDDAIGKPVSATVGDDAWDEKPNVGGCDAPTLGQGPSSGRVGGQNLPATCGAWPLYQVKRLANDGDARKNEGNHSTPLVGVFDVEEDSNGNGNPCDDFVNQRIAVPNPLSPNGKTEVAWILLPDVRPSVNSNPTMEGSIAGTYAHLLQATNATNVNVKHGECSPDDHTFAMQLESAARDAEYVHRRPADNLTWIRDSRLHTLGFAGFDNLDVDVPGVDHGPAGPTGPQGTTGGSFSTTVGGPGWFGRARWPTVVPRMGWGATDVAYATFYADVTPQALVQSGLGAKAATALPSGQDAFRYGIPEFCPAITTGPSNVNLTNDWECSVDVWDAKRKVDNNPGRKIIGDAYDLRDVDCFDNSVSDKHAPGVRAGLVTCEATHK